MVYNPNNPYGKPPAPTGYGYGTQPPAYGGVLKAPPQLGQPGTPTYGAPMYKAQDVAYGHFGQPKPATSQGLYGPGSELRPVVNAPVNSSGGSVSTTVPTPKAYDPRSLPKTN